MNEAHRSMCPYVYHLPMMQALGTASPAAARLNSNTQRHAYILLLIIPAPCTAMGPMLRASMLHTYI